MPHTVLLVDWNGESREIYGALLRHHGFATLQASGGVEGYRLASAHRPDLILLDLFVPGLDGWAVLRQLRQDPGTSTIPLILLTTFAEASHLDALRGQSAHSFAKPYQPSELLRLVRHLFAETPLVASPREGEKCERNGSGGPGAPEPLRDLRTST